MPFIALEVAHQLIRAVRAPLAKLRRFSGKLADQAEEAASSVPMNVAEGNRRVGKDRLHFFRVAAGSAGELQSALEVAADWAYLSDDDLVEVRPVLDRELGLLWGLTHSRR